MSAALLVHRRARRRPLPPVTRPAVDQGDAPTRPLTMTLLLVEHERAAHRAAVAEQDRPALLDGPDRFEWGVLAVGSTILVGAMYVVVAVLRWWV